MGEVLFLGFHSKIRISDAWELEDLSSEVKKALSCDIINTEH